MRRRDGEIEFEPQQFRNRARMLAALLALAALTLIGRSMQLQVFDRQFIERQADIRHARTRASATKYVVQTSAKGQAGEVQRRTPSASATQSPGMSTSSIK